jgi:hypothetical protein
MLRTLHRTGWWVSLSVLVLATLVMPAPARAQGLGPGLLDGGMGTKQLLTLPASTDVADWRVGDPAISETFGRSPGQWKVDAGDAGARFITEGVLAISVEDPQQIIWSAYNNGTYGDFYLEVVTGHAAGPIDNLLGVVFRMQDADNFYFYVFSSDGYYALGRFLDDESEMLIPWTRVDEIEAGEQSVNLMGLLAEGNEFVLLANGEELARVEDDAIPGAGQLALVGGTNGEGGTIVAFDNLLVWTGGGSAAGQDTPRGAFTRRGTQPSQPAQPAQPAQPSTPSETGGNAVVATDTLNVRGGPGTNYPVIGRLQQGDIVLITGRSSDSQWVKIAAQDIDQAWISAQYLVLFVDLPDIPVAQAPAAPAAQAPAARPPAASAAPAQQPAARANVAYLVIENHIGKHITVQVNDKNFRVEGKVGDRPGRYQFILEGVGRYRVAAQAPNAGSHNWDLYVVERPEQCANRQGCVALGQTFLQTYY